MFSGLVDHKGVIVESSGQRLTIESQFAEIVLGESIAVDGVCLTAIAPVGGRFSADVSPETLKMTTLGDYSIGREVNLERSLRVGDRLGGHFVSGHVDKVATVAHIEQQAEYWSVRFAFSDTSKLNYLVHKGSITVNGTSLTINALMSDGFIVTIIPHTLATTSLGKMAVGTKVNIEFDMIAKMVASSRSMEGANESYQREGY